MKSKKATGGPPSIGSTFLDLNQQHCHILHNTITYVNKFIRDV